MSFKCSQNPTLNATHSFRFLLTFHWFCSLRLIQCLQNHLFVKTSRGFSKIPQRHYPPRSINRTDVLWRSYLVKLDEISSKAILRNGRGHLNFLKCCDDYIRRGRKSEALGICQRRQLTATCGLFATNWTSSKLFRGRDADAVTIGILCWFSEHVCSRHVHKVSAKSLYAVHNLLNIFIWFPQPYFHLKRHVNNYRILYGTKRTHLFPKEKKNRKYFYSLKISCFFFRHVQNKSYIFFPLK